MKAKSTKRLLAAFLALAMVAVLLPAGILGVRAEEVPSSWDFTTESYDATGLNITGSYSWHGEKYGIQAKNATIEVPVSGNAEIIIGVGYTWDITFPDGTNQLNTSDGGHQTVSYIHKGEAGTVTITIGGNCTTYIKSIKVTEVSEPLTAWDFTTEDYVSTGLKITGSYSWHGEKYGIQAKNATIEVPVSGNAEIIIGVGYTWDITFPDGTNQLNTSDGGHQTVSYIHKGEAGTVTITIGGNCTTYIKSIEVTEVSEPLTSWDFTPEDYVSTGLKFTGSYGWHSSGYGIQAKNATIEVPVSGNAEIIIGVGYTWDITFPDGTNQLNTSDGGHQTVSYIHKGEAGTVTITIGGNCTTYIKSIEVTEVSEPLTSWDFTTEDYVSTGLKFTGSYGWHSSGYGIQAKNATIEVPVSGNAEIIIGVGYTWDITFPDGTNQLNTSDGGHQTVSYIHKGEAGTVTITIGGNCTTYIKSIEVIPVEVAEVPELDTGKIYVWDFGAEALDESIYVNMLTVDEINSWFADVEPGTTGKNIASFETADGLLCFNDGGYPTTHRLRSTNTALTRYDDKSLKDADGNVFSGYIYSNKSSDSSVYVGIKVNAGEKVTLAVGSNGNDSLINFESPSGVVTTGEFLSSGAKIQLLTFYPAETGLYKIYSTTEKLVLARITREACNDITVTGSVTAPESLSGYSIIFTNPLSGMTYETTVDNGHYSITLKDGYSYELSLKDANGYVITSEKTLSFEKGCGNSTADIVIEQVDLVTVTGNIVGLNEDALAKIGIAFKADTIYIPEITVSGSTYTAILEKGVTYEIVISGINDYILSGASSVSYDADATADITLEAKPVYSITIAPEGATLADLAGATFTFTNLNEEGYVYTFTGTDNIALRDGVYSVKVTNAGIFVQQLTSNLKVNGSDVTKTVPFSSDITVWDFSASDFTGENNAYNGLIWTNAVKNKTYLLAKDGTITIPVSGNCQIAVSACYQYSFYFESESEASVGIKTGSTSQIDTFTYDYVGGEGTVTITVLGQSYLTKIEILESVPYSETVTVGMTGCDYTTITDALKAVASMSRPNNERVTILIQPGNYEEMLVVNVPNVTLKNASENPSIALTDKGVGIDTNAVRITWYYGHGYTYYSMGSDYKFNETVLQVNKENGYPSTENPGAGTVTYWNASVVIAADGFRAEGIIFENSFNQYISDKAAQDILVALGGAKEGSTPRAELPAGSTAVQGKAYVERATALAIVDGMQQIYFENCKFVGRQDTLYGGHGALAAFYDCAIYGGTDYIFGGMTAVFAKCDLVFNTSEDKNDVGYITAAQQKNGRGYLMYNCTITSTTPGVDTASEYTSKPGYFGRPWQANTSEVIFYHTIIDATDPHWFSSSASLIHADGWLSTLSGESKITGEYGTYEYALGVDNTGNRVSWAQVFTEELCADGTPMTIANFLGEWNAFEGKDLTIEIPTEKVNNDPDAQPDEEEPTPDRSEHSFDSLVDVTPGADKDAIAEGTTFAEGFFTVIGTVTQRFSESKGGVFAIEIGKNGTGAIQFTTAQTGKVTIVVSSTGGSNTSAVALIDAEGNVIANVEGLSEISGTYATTLTWENLPAGTYQIVSPESEYNRGFRLMTIDVEEGEDAPSEGETNEHKFNSLTDVTPGADKDAIAEGTTFSDGYFTVIGTVTQRFSESKGGVFAIEIGKNLAGAIEFTVNGNAEITISVSSTGGSNTSVVAIMDADGNIIESTEVSGTSATTLTWSLAAGTYRIVSPESEYNRGFRLMTIDVIESGSSTETPEDPDTPVDPEDPEDPVEPEDPIVPEDPVDPENPKDGDMIGLVLAMMLVSGSAAIAVIRKKEF